MLYSVFSTTYDASDEDIAWQNFLKEQEADAAIFEEASSKEKAHDYSAALSLYRKFIIVADEKKLTWDINIALERIDLYSGNYAKEIIDEYLQVKQLSLDAILWWNPKEIEKTKVQNVEDPEKHNKLVQELCQAEKDRKINLARTELLKLESKDKFPLRGFVLFSLGGLAYHYEDYAAAMAWYKKLIQNYPKSSRYDDALFMLAKTYYHTYLGKRRK